MHRLIEDAVAQADEVEEKYLQVSVYWCLHTLANRSINQSMCLDAVAQSWLSRVKKGKGFPYSLPSVGPRADPDVLASDYKSSTRW